VATKIVMRHYIFQNNLFTEFHYQFNLFTEVQIISFYRNKKHFFDNKTLFTQVIGRIIQNYIRYFNMK
jgi:hypothetical protein